MEFFCTVPKPHFLGRALIWPCCFGEHILGLFGLYSSSLSKSVRFVSLSGKASLVSISAAILFLRSWHVYFPIPLEFINWCLKLQKLAMSAIKFETFKAHMKTTYRPVKNRQNHNIKSSGHDARSALLDLRTGTIHLRQLSF